MTLDESTTVDMPSDPLEWLGDILWPYGSARIRPASGHADLDGTTKAGGGETAAGSESDDPAKVWWASPSAEAPKLLVPASPEVARSAVRRYHDGFSPAQRLRSLAAETVMRLPRAPKLLLDRHRVVTVPSQGGARVSPGVLGGISEALGIGDLRVAVSLSQPKSNRKPILQLLDSQGRVHGWAKVAWNGWSDALVANEARWLQHRPLPPLAMPSLLADLIVEGQRVVVTSGFTASRRPSRRPDQLPDPSVFKAVAALGTQSEGSVLDSAWIRSVDKVLKVASMDEQAAITTMFEAAAHRRLQFGAWHGDLTPWNIMTAHRTAQVIDWEFAADEVPFGFDLCHFHTQVGTEIKGLDASTALDYSARLSPQGLSRLGVAPQNQAVVFRLYLVELVRRTLALRAAGYDLSEVNQGRAALARLQRSQPDLGRTRRTDQDPLGTDMPEARDPLNQDPVGTEMPEARDPLNQDPLGIEVPSKIDSAEQILRSTS